MIAPVPRPAPAPIGGYVSFVAQQALLAKGDWAGYGAERDRLMQASEMALRAEPWTRAVGEPVEGAGSRFQIFDRPLAMGDSLRAVRVALLVSAGERNMARAFYLTTSADLTDPTKSQYFLDAYRCDGRSTLKYFGALPTPP